MSQGLESAEFWKTKPNNSGNHSICNVCRLCANFCDNRVPIFDKINEKGSIYSKLKKCIPSILLLESDIKPKYICLSCASKLELCFSFIEMSLDTDCKFEATLQSKMLPQFQIVNENVNKSLDLSWLQIKQEPVWSEIKKESALTQNEQKSDNVETVFSPPKQFQQALVQLPVTTSNQLQLTDETNLGILLNKQDSNHNVLQSLVVPDGISSQDLILLVELKCKDFPTVDMSQKKDLSLPNINENVKLSQSNEELNNFQTKIVDTGGNIRVINLSDFDGKFNQSDKVTSSFVGDSVASTASILKAFENDVLNGVLKLDPMNTENTLAETLKSRNDTPNFEATMMATTSNVEPIRSTPQTQTRDFSCNICGKQFTRRNRLNAHLARHSSVRPHSCDKCDQRFITRWDLTLHLRIHSGMFSCEYCGKAFPAKGKLERHRRTHTGERPFPCDQCNKAFSEKRNLENHLKIHAAAEAKKILFSCHCSSCGLQFNANVQKNECDLCVKKESCSKISVNGVNIICKDTNDVNDVSSSNVTRFLET